MLAGLFPASWSSLNFVVGLISFLVLNPIWLKAQNPVSSNPFVIARDSYGVPKVTSDSLNGLFEGQGYADAQDRLWQMDLSRHLSEGHLAELIGPTGVQSDRNIDQTGYTKAEVQDQIDKLPPNIQANLNSYAAGVNLFMQSEGLPPDYASAHISPQPWSAIDSASISIYLFKLFGRGGAGQIRDWALLQYLKSRPQLRDHILDVFNDIAFIQDKSAPTTISDADDLSRKPHPTFQNPTNEITQAQLVSLPKISIFELLPALNIAESTSSKLIANKLAVPYRTGSYCIAVSGKRSATGTPILLSGPQMGFSDPSIVHEIALRGPGLSLTGIDVPGMSGIVIGSNGDVTWGITSGVADTEDAFVYHSPDASHFDFDGKTKPLERINFEIPVAGDKSQTYVQVRTNWGPSILRSSQEKSLVILRSASRNQELQSLSALYGLYSAKTAQDALKAGSVVTMSFNLFFADKQGNIGWRYCGLVPARHSNTDPRLPLIASSATDWLGMIQPEKMPQSLNPQNGLLFDWNGKPVSWWLNGDTPAWGSIFHTSLIRRNLHNLKLTTTDVERCAWDIARQDPNWDALKRFAMIPNAPPWINGYQGWNFDGSFASEGWQKLEESIRKHLFLTSVGNFLGTGFFDTILQPSVILAALDGKSHFNYLAGRSAKQIFLAAFKDIGIPSRYVAPSIPYKGFPPVPYSNRGSYIQIAEIDGNGNWSMRSNTPPGETESGDHHYDQIDLAREWIYKQTWLGIP